MQPWPQRAKGLRPAPVHAARTQRSSQQAGCVPWAIASWGLTFGPGVVSLWPEESTRNLWCLFNVYEITYGLWVAASLVPVPLSRIL